MSNQTIPVESRRFYLGLAKRVKKLRHERGFTQQELADRLGLSRASIANIECGRQRLLIDTARDLAKILRTDLGSLLGVRS